MKSELDRIKPRCIVRFPGEISNDYTETLNCMVVDFSVSGARIHVNPKHKIPQRFVLRVQVLPDIPPLELRCRRVWANKDVAGLHFEKMSQRDTQVIDSIVRVHRGDIKQPEAENAA